MILGDGDNNILVKNSFKVTFIYIFFMSFSLYQIDSFIKKERDIMIHWY